MFCIEQAKIYREPKYGSDKAFNWWLTYLETKMSNICLIDHFGTATWRLNFNQNGQIKTQNGLDITFNQT